MVEMPNVDVSREMIDLISASRAYEANLTVVKTSRRLAQQAMAIGK
jgi:flagellar basal-body rod protein FlgC